MIELADVQSEEDARRWVKYQREHGVDEATIRLMLYMNYYDQGPEEAERRTTEILGP